ncbi:MAG: hypothetical protein NUV90_01750 [Candidatus Parcubacteria bacterium]|nr:hypothetical protein [Candidatus Parcubacteria bacterium]
MNDVPREQHLNEQISALRPKLKSWKRVLFICILGFFGSLLILTACVSERPSGMSPVDAYGVSPLFCLLFISVMVVIAGWMVEEVENRIHKAKAEIRDMHEIDG